MIEIDGHDFAVIYKQIQTVDKEIAKALRKRLTAAGKPLLAEVRRAALSLPSSGGGASGYRKKRGSKGGDAGFRQGIARAAELKVQTSRPTEFNIRIRISGSKFNEATGKTRTLPRYMEGLSKRAWRHPVFVPRSKMPGPPGSWVSQASHPYLLPTVMPHKGEVADAVRKAFLDALSELHIAN